MKPLDRLLAAWRGAKARRYIGRGVRLLDVGCGNGRFLKRLSSVLSEGIGIDPDVNPADACAGIRLIRGSFPEACPDNLGPFDVITMLAFLEHLPTSLHARLAERCAALLRPGGLLILTVPEPAVDRIAHVLQRIPWLYDGTHTEQHYGFQPSQTPAIFSVLELVMAGKFQLGLNNLFVFRRPRA